MKTILKLTAIIPAFMLFSCGGNENKNESTDQHSHTDSTEHVHSYICPMNCENGKTYSEPGKCPKCGMNLEHNDEAATKNTNTYIMNFKSSGELEAGKEATLFFTPAIKGKDNEEVPLDVHHDKKIHLIIASNDLSYFEHIHPEYQADGSYQINILPKGKEFAKGRGHNETKFENGGNYQLFADYAPSGGTHQLEKIPVTVKGTSAKEVVYTKEKLSSTVDGFTVSLEADGEKWLTNQPMHIKAIIKKDNKVLDANTLENYLSAKAHMVVLKTETFEYLHVHPEVENGTLDLHTSFENPGVYRGWIQFQTEGKVHTADFVIKVEQGEKNANTEAAHSDHKH
ncbi:MAG: hypothetical protein M3R27_04880 [Bacteroidota bacterium]|nr:hypothetical protein [Bacteroidota bacterium]